MRIQLGAVGSPKDLPFEVEASHISTYRDRMQNMSSLSSLEQRNECSEGCQVFWDVVLYPFVFIYQIISWPFVKLYELIFGQDLNSVPEPDLSLPDAPDYSEDLINAAQDYRACGARMKDRPEPFDLQSVIIQQEQLAHPILVDDLLTRFDEIFTNSDCSQVQEYGGKYIFNRNSNDESKAYLADRPFEIQMLVGGELLRGMGYGGYVPMRQIIKFYIDFIKERDIALEGTSNAYYDNLEIIVKNIIFELGKPEIDTSKKRNLMVELAEAYTNCNARKYEEALWQYRKLINRSENLDNLVRIWLQEFKEEVIMQHYQIHGMEGMSVHILNHARKEVGDEFGLNDLGLVENDPWVFAYDNDEAFRRRNRYQMIDFNPEEYKRLLNAHYTTEALLQVVSCKIESENVSRVINEYLQNEYTQETITDDDLELMYTNSVDENGSSQAKLNYKGVAILLERLGFLEKIS